MADFVLEPLPPEDETVLVELLPTLVDGVRVWIEEGAAAAANRYNR
jgi:hypothetical protein